MSNIRVLPEILANKIAAGEIVERPASVVKELLENCIDAGSHAISVELGSGGKRFIRIQDDGEGMTQDDAILAFEHHATSKLQTVEDLAAISTLGFRGEALPSIASISRVELRTKDKSKTAEAGSEIQIQGGKIRSVKAVSWDKGTEVTVRDIFFNVPARRKFLRSRETELGHITRLVTQYSLAHPEIHYTLRSEGRLLLEVAPVSAVRDRVYQLFGEEFMKNLLSLSGSDGLIQLHGFCSRPHEQRTNPYSQFYFVNRRMVRDKVIRSAVRQAYRHTMPSSAYPIVVIFLELPYDEVDVNAHPAKTEIRFRQQGMVHDLIRDTIQQSLVESKSIPAYSHRDDQRHSVVAGSNDNPVSPSSSIQSTPAFDFTPPSAASDPFQRAFNYPFKDVPVSAFPSSQDHVSVKMRADMLLGAPSDPSDHSANPFHSSGIRILGQIQDSYIVGCDVDGLLIIDQHVAHERVLYEKNAMVMRERSVKIQGLLVPITLELSPHQLAILERTMEDLNRNGFEVELFGGNTVLIRSVPTIARDYDCHKLLTEILEGLEAEERTLNVERIQDRIAVSMACHGAIKVNMPLTHEKMQWLLDELAKTRIPTNCPHGRPIILRFSMYEIERNFGRT